RLEGQVKELQTAKAEIEEQAKRLSADLVQENKRREGAELQISEISRSRTELEAQLSALRQELEAAQRGLQSQQENSSAWQSSLEERIKQLEAEEGHAKEAAAWEKQAAAEETKRRENAER